MVANARVYSYAMPLAAATGLSIIKWLTKVRPMTSPEHVQGIQRRRTGLEAEIRLIFPETLALTL